MNDDKVIKLIDILVDETKNKKHNWERLISYFDIVKENEMINYFTRNILEENDYSVEKIDSFFVKYHSGYVFIFKLINAFFDEEKYVIGLQKSVSSKIKMQNGIGKNDSEIMRLVYHIEDFLDNTDDYLSSIIKKK